MSRKEWREQTRSPLLKMSAFRESKRHLLSQSKGFWSSYGLSAQWLCGILLSWYPSSTSVLRWLRADGLVSSTVCSKLLGTDPGRTHFMLCASLPIPLPQSFSTDALEALWVTLQQTRDRVTSSYWDTCKKVASQAYSFSPFILFLSLLLLENILLLSPMSSARITKMTSMLNMMSTELCMPGWRR